MSYPRHSLVGVLPLCRGAVSVFYSPSWLGKVQSKDFQRNHHAIVPKFSACSDTRVNFVMNPIKSYPDPFAEIFVKSQVERNLEKMFDADSLGIFSEDEATCDYDQHKIMEFVKSIEFGDNAYHVKLPWHENKIKSVPSNHRVALSVLNRVVNKLEQKTNTQWLCWGIPSAEEGRYWTFWGSTWGFFKIYLDTS